MSSGRTVSIIKSNVLLRIYPFKQSFSTGSAAALKPSYSVVITYLVLYVHLCGPGPPVVLLYHPWLLSLSSVITVT